MTILFYDILENTSPIFKITRERPITDVVLNYLNDAQLTFFNSRYLPGRFTENIQVIKSLKFELADLFTTTTGATVSTDGKFTHSKVIDSIDWGDYATFVEGTLTVTRISILTGTSQNVELIPIEDFNVNKYITNYTNKPLILQPVVFMDSDESLTIIHDAYTSIGSATVTLLNKPAKMNYSSQDCQLHERFHEQIVRIATDMFLQDKLKVESANKQKGRNDSSGNAA